MIASVHAQTEYEILLDIHENVKLNIGLTEMELSDSVSIASTLLKLSCDPSMCSSAVEIGLQNNYLERKKLHEELDFLDSQLEMYEQDILDLHEKEQTT